MNNSRPIWHFCICHFIFVHPLMRNDITKAATRRDHEFICVQCIELSISYFKSSTIKSNLLEEFNEAKFTYLIASLTVSIQPAIHPSAHPIPFHTQYICKLAYGTDSRTVDALHGEELKNDIEFIYFNLIQSICENIGPVSCRRHSLHP